MKTAAEEKIFIIIMIILTLVFLKNIVVNLAHRQLSAPEDHPKQHEEETLRDDRSDNSLVKKVQLIFG